MLITALIFLFYYKFHIGETTGLEASLSKLKGVEAVNGYKVRDGSASFILNLKRGEIGLHNVGNDDLAGNGSGFMIFQVGGFGLGCKSESGGLSSFGVTALEIQKQYFPNLSLNSVSGVIKYYKEIETLFSSGRVKFVYRSFYELEEEDVWYCYRK